MSTAVSRKEFDMLAARLDAAFEKSERSPEEFRGAEYGSGRASTFGRIVGRLVGESPLERQFACERQHAERLRALEMGRPLPEIERLRLDTQRKLSGDRTGSIILFLLGLVGAPLAIAGICVGATGVVLSQSAPEDQRLHMAVIWTAAVCIVVAVEVGLAFFGMLVLRPILANPWSDERGFPAPVDPTGKSPAN